MASSEGDNYRSYLNESDEVNNIKWRFGSAPNYDVVNKLFEQGKTKTWPAGSLEEKVQNLVKTWEMEMFNKVNFDDYRTVDPIKYRFSLNGRKGITLEEKRKLGGGYNSLLQTSLPQKFRGYNPAEETVDSSHRAFTTAFPRGFALEILEVYSGPPAIVYKFRHWGFMEGPFKGYAPTGEMVELFGMSIFELDEQSKIVKVEFFYDRGELLGGLMKGNPSEISTIDTSSTCPFLKSTG